MSGIIENKKKISKELLVALYLFQFGFMQPFASLVNSQGPIVVSTAVIFAIAMWSNGFRIKKYNIVIGVSVIIYFILNMFLESENYLIILSILFSWITKCFSGVYIGSMDVDGSKLYKSFLKVATFNFIAIGLHPFIDFFDSMNYMRFGYALLPSLLMFFLAIIKEKHKLIWIILFVCSFLEVIIYGSRGPIIGILIFILLSIIFTSEIKVYKKIIVSIVLSMCIAVIYKYEILIDFIDYLYINYGYQSYSISKLKMMLEQGFLASSSGRDLIYLQIWDAFKVNPIFGRGVGYAQYTWDWTSHNIILQILLESGVSGLVFWIIVSLTLAIKYIKSRINVFLFYIFTLLISISLGRLSVSSDMWLRTELWIAISMLINYNYKKIILLDKRDEL